MTKIARKGSELYSGGGEFRWSPFHREGDVQCRYGMGRLAGCLFLLLLTIMQGHGQSPYQLHIVPVDRDTAFFSGLSLTLTEHYPDTAALFSGLNGRLQLLRKAGYLTASVDSLVMRDTIWNAYLYTGKAFHWAGLRNGNIEPGWLEQIGFRERLYSGDLLDQTAVAVLFESLIGFAENHGFPFAAVRMDSVTVSGDRVSGVLMMQKNRLIRFDEVQVKGEMRISPRYLQMYLGIRKGALYDKSKLLAISGRIRELPFLQEKQPPTVTFKGERAFVNLFVEKKKASRFDFIVGVAPNSQWQAPGKVLLTGTFNADFSNQFGAGERLFVEFQRLRPQTQRLDLRFAYPYMVGLPFGVDMRLDLYKRDSTQLDAMSDFGLQYLLEGGNYVKIFWNSIQSSLLQFSESAVIGQRQLPPVLDVRRNFFGLEWLQRRLDYRWNPRRGWSVWIRGAAGVKRIRENNEIVQLVDPEAPDFDFSTLYDSLVLRSGQFKVEAKLDRYIPLGRQSTFRLGLHAGGQFSQQPLLQNEQYRIGGFNSLRGFDEEAFFATRYGIGTVEYRLLLGQNSYLYAFFDAGYVQHITALERSSDVPMGTGAGLSFETPAGIFGIALAVGRRQGGPFDFRSVKTHLGYVSLF